MNGSEVNKRVVENFIRAGAFDCFGKYRRQLIMVYMQLMDQAAADRKKNISGQMTLFDFMGDEEKQKYEIHYPNVEEFDKELMLAYEKEVLGIYVSGHPLDDYADSWRKNVTANALDFMIDDETGQTLVKDQEKVTIGGMITERTVKTTKTQRLMAFITLEDLVGSVEVIVFPGDYERNQDVLKEDSKIYVRGRVSVNEDQPAKLIAEKIIPFDEVPKEVWIAYPDKSAFLEDQTELIKLLSENAGNNRVVVFCRAEKIMKKMPASCSISASDNTVAALRERYGKQCVKIREMKI
jgi:DNA polymerase-3 subunit alpha